MSGRGTKTSENRFAAYLEGLAYVIGHADRKAPRAAPNPNDAAQWAWDDYCERHLEKYDEYFGPDVIPGWDQPKTPLPEKPIDLGPQPERFVRVLGAGRKPRP